VADEIEKIGRIFAVVNGEAVIEPDRRCVQPRATGGRSPRCTASCGRGGEMARSVIKLLRGLIDHIIVEPTERPELVRLKVSGNLAALLVEHPAGAGVAESMVAGARSHLYRTQLSLPQCR